VFAANEHHCEARRTSNGCQARSAKLTEWHVGRRSRTTIWAVEGFCLHPTPFYQLRRRKEAGQRGIPVSSRLSETSTGGAALLAREAAGKIQASKNSVS
jgi:hypothetical protein